MSIGTLSGHLVLLESTQDVANLETLLEVIILVCIDQLKVFASVKYYSMILVVRLPVLENWIARELDPELWSPLSSLGVELGVAVDESRKKSRIPTLLPRWFLLKVCDLELGTRMGAGILRSLVPLC